MAYGGAGAAMGTFLFSLLYNLSCLVYLDALFLEEVDAILKIFPSPDKLEHHDALFSGENLSFQYIERQIEIRGQLADQWLLHFGFREMQNQYF